VTTRVETTLKRYDEAVRDVAALPEIGDLAGARVCVVGFTGQVGSAIVRVLVEANRTTLAADPIHVTGIARHSRPSVPAGIDAVYVDVARGVPAERFTHVVYAAGVTSDYRSRPRDVIESQLVGLETMLERLTPGCTFVFVSSARVYGRTLIDEPLSEDSVARVTPMHLDNLYDSAKRLAESLCLWHAERGDVRAIVARAGNLYGLDSPRSSTSVSELVRQATTTGRITLTGNPASLRNYCCTVDFAQGLLRAAVRGQSGSAYNIGSDEHLTTEELASRIAESLGNVDVVAPSDPGPPSYQRLDIQRASRELGYAPTLSIAEVLPAVAAELQTGS
jgi:nucleoside-diphosphate-sugar epimerase